MKMFDNLPLSGGWEVAQYPADAADYDAPELSGLNFIPAEVPGAVQYDLMAAEKLENPYASTQAAFSAAWVAKNDWLYRKSFRLDEIPETRRWFLNIDGVDTFSEIWLNGEMVGETRNNYRYYQFPLADGLLHPNENLIVIRVKAHHRMIFDKITAAARLGHDSDDVEGLMGKSLIRRYQRSFFTNSSLLNIGTGVLGIGINRPVSLEYFGVSRITDWVLRTLSLENGAARCELQVQTDGVDCGLRAVITNPQTGEDIAVLDGAVKDGALTLPVEITNPELWWPTGYGKPFLYRLRLELLSGGECIHSLEREVGFKTAELVTKLPNGRNTFHFRVNGKRIWARGQNTIPPDYIKVYGTPEEERRMFRLLENAHTNMIRVWGGGMPAGEAFYSACDRLGIMLWADGFLHSNVYPDYDPGFVEEYAGECRELLKCVRRHVSLCVVCGGNEQIEGWEEFGWQGRIDRFYGETLFTQCMPPISAELCPEIPYIINSPHGGADCQSPVVGDAHNWGNYFNSFKDPLFVSETCWSQESYSRPETLEKRMDMQVDDYSGQGWFSRWTKQTSRTRIGRLAYSGWHHDDNPSLRRYLHTLELEQARADYNALRQFRLRSPSNSGVIYWSFNKGGPLFQFGCVDYCGYPMMSYYVVKRLYQSVAAGLFRDGEDICITVSNQSGGMFKGAAELVHLHSDGREIDRIFTDVTMNDGESGKVFASPELYRTVIDRTREVFFLRLRDDSGNIVDEDILFVCPFFEFVQNDTPVKAWLDKLPDEAWELSIETVCVIRQLEIECNHKHLCSDNYFPMIPGEIKKIRVEILENTCDKPPCLEIRTLGASHSFGAVLQSN